MSTVSNFPAGIIHKLAKIDRSAKLQYWILLFITCVAAAVRFYKLGEWSFWFDEIFTIEAAQNPAIYNLTWPRISLMLIGTSLKYLGVSEMSARLVPALIGTMTIPTLYFAVRKMFGAGIALLSAVLLTVSPWHIFWSQNARFYTSLMLLYTLALIIFYYAIEEDRPLYLIISLILLALSTIERFIALFLVPVVFIYLLLLKLMPVEKPPGLRLRNLLLMLLPGIAFGILEAYSFVSKGNSLFLDSYMIFSSNRGPDPLRLLSFIIFDLGIPLVCLAFFAGIYLVLQKSRAGLFFFLGAVVPAGVLLLANPFMYTNERYVFISLPGWIVLGAIAIREIFSDTRNYRWVFAVGVLVLVLADSAQSNLLYYHVNNGDRPDWRGAFELIQERSTDGDVFISYWPTLGAYYLHQDVLSLQDIELEILVGGGKRLWFVIDNFAVWSVPRKSRWVEQHAELIDVRYLRKQADSSLSIYLYDPLQHNVWNNR